MNNSYKVVEMFTSINGEGRYAGQLAVFVRFAGCNLQCNYCDTMWANQPDVTATLMTREEILQHIEEEGVTRVTLTGGEPLLRSGLAELIGDLIEHGQLVEIETNGSVDLAPYLDICKDERLTFTMDYKLAGSGMEDKMVLSNLELLRGHDTLKFVVSSIDDLERAYQLIEEYGLDKTCHVYFSPVFGRIEPETMVEFVKEKRLNNVTIQVQLHKIIWDPQKRGV